MAYNIKYRCTHKTNVNDTETTYVIEILEDGFVGSITDVKGIDDVFSLNYENIDPTTLYDNPIQKGRLEFYLAVRGQGTDAELNYDGFSILEEIFNADEEQFQMRLKVNGSVYWTGYVLNDLLEYPEGEYVYSGKIIAKDLTRLAGSDHPLLTDRVTVIKTIGDILANLNLGLDIKTYTSWINEQTNDADDILHQIYNERKALRDFANTGEETDTKISNEEALLKILTNYGLILRQSNNAWRLYQLTALETPTAVDEFTYSSSSVQQSTGSVDITQDVDRVARYILPTSTNQVNPAVKRVKNKFDHRTGVTNITFEEVVNLVGSNSTTESQLFISDGDQKFKFSISWIDADFTGGPYNNVHADFRISIDTGGTIYYWNNDDRIWQTTDYINEVDLTQALGTSGGRGSVELTTTDVPAAADGNLVIEVFGAVGTHIDTGTVTGADNTRFENIEFGIFNAIAKENSKHILYELTQTGSYSVNIELPDTWFGDGPTGYAPSALRHGSSDGDTTSDNWQRRGTTTGYRNFHENLEKEALDVQRSSTKNLQGVLLGEYDVSNILSYSGSYMFFLGGSLNGKESEWSGDLLNLTIQTASNDQFDDIPKFTNEDGSGTSTAGGSTGTGLSKEEADSIYLNEDNNLSDLNDASASRVNLDVYSTGEVDGFLDGVLEASDITGSANQIIVSESNGTLTFSTPQDIATSSNVEFAEITGSNVIFNNQRLSGTLEVTGSSTFNDDIKFNNHLYRGIATPDSLFHIEGSTAGSSGGGSGSIVHIVQNTSWTGAQPYALFVEGYTNLNGFRINGADGQRSLYKASGELGFGTNNNDITFSPDNAGGTRKIIIEAGTGFLGLQTLSPSGSLDVSGSTFLRGDIEFQTQINSDDYTNGILGSGTLVDNEASNGSFIEVDNMRIRESLRTHIFKKDIVRASNGLLYVSDASEIVDTVTTPATTGSSFVLSVKESVFETGDDIWYKDADDSGTINSVRASITDNGTSRTLDGKTVYDFSASLDEGTSVDLKAGDTVVRTSGPNILLDASSEFAPFIDINTGSAVRARLGYLDGISDNINGKTVEGYGLYSDNAFLKGGIVATYGTIGGFDIGATVISSSNGDLVLRSDGQITGSNVLFDGGEIGGFELSSTQIKSSNNDLILKSNGQITGSNVLFTGGRFTGEVTASDLRIENNFSLGVSMSIDAGGRIDWVSGSISDSGINLDTGPDFARQRAITWNDNEDTSIGVYGASGSGGWMNMKTSKGLRVYMSGSVGEHLALNLDDTFVADGRLAVNVQARFNETMIVPVGTDKYAT